MQTVPVDISGATATVSKSVGLDLPDGVEALAPIVAALPLQLFAYEVAVARGTDVDQPRNLAKSVTVE